MTAWLNARMHDLTNPAVLGPGAPATVRNTYLVSMAMIALTPLMLLSLVVAPVLTPLVLPIAATVVIISFIQIVLIRIDWFRPETGPALTIVAWAMLTWAAWQTGGLYSPALYALVVLVVLAQMCNGWLWGLVTLIPSALTILAFAFARVSGVFPAFGIQISPLLYAAIVGGFVVALSSLVALLIRRMGLVESQLDKELGERRKADQRLQRVIGNAPFGALMCHLDGGTLMVTQVNDLASVVLNTDADRLVGSRVADAFPDADRTLAKNMRRVAALGGTHDTGALPFYASGEHRVLDMHSFQIEPGYLAAFFTDVTEKRDAELEINRLAYTDNLTELPNRSLLHSRLSTAIADAHARTTQVAVLFVDLDDFKPVNDLYGHDAGDQLLVAVGRRLQGCTRSTDTVARLGGDEFTMIISDISTQEQAETVARKAVSSLREPFLIDGHAVHVTASVGVALTSDGDDDANALLAHSDVAMYQAKEAGRDGYRVYEAGAA